MYKKYNVELRGKFADMLIEFARNRIGCDKELSDKDAIEFTLGYLAACFNMGDEVVTPNGNINGGAVRFSYKTIEVE